MIALQNDSLTVWILDPVADREWLGTRYCTGGFIFQVEDHDGSPARGNLLSGPTYPHSYNLFDGQGAPDAFHPHLVIDQDPDGTPVRVLGIGIGEIDAKANTVIVRCAWDVWYPHPFFPLSPSGECCKMNVPCRLPDNPGYELLDNGFLHMKHLPWTDSENHFQLLGLPGTSPMSFLQKHPLTSLVSAACDYVPSRVPVWGNRVTFSFEPYYERNLQPTEMARWSITYDF
ncbi:MAG: hypothetical protein NTU88_09275 [Armatimonadetes bacterium]|nr:hypothetical protein [Armatimonadota bacterium]